MKIRFLVLLLLSIVCLQKSYAQGGYLNKKNQVSFDFFNPFFSGDYGLSLTRSIKENVALSIGCKINSKSTNQLREFHDNGDEGFMVFLAFVDKEFREHIPIWGTSKGIMFEFNILGSGLSGMQMPLGHYWGYGYEIYRGSFDQNELIGDIMYTSSYTNRSHKIKAFYGKNTYVKSNFTIDMRLEFGLQWGKSSTLNPTNLVAHFPFYRGIFNTNFFRDTSSENGLFYDKYVGAFIYPKLSVAYLF